MPDSELGIGIPRRPCRYGLPARLTFPKLSRVPEAGFAPAPNAHFYGAAPTVTGRRRAMQCEYKLPVWDHKLLLQATLRRPFAPFF